MPEKETDVVVFGDYELDYATRQLRHQGEPVALQPRVFELLGFLIRHRSRAVNKDEIQEAVWTGTIVSETALTRAIMKARRAVGDSADQQRVIRTVHGHGYQFVASVLIPTTVGVEPDQQKSDSTAEGHTDLSTSLTDSSASETATHAPRSSAVEPPARRHVGQLILAGISALSILAVLAVWFFRTPAASDDIKLAVLPVLNGSQSEELDWVKLGLLGFANDLLQSSTELAVVPASDLVKFAENRADLLSPTAPDPSELLLELRSAFGATHVIASDIESTVGGLRLNYRLYNEHGEISRSTMVSEQSTELVRGMVREVNNTLTKARYLSTDTHQSGDPFISEAYARGVSYALKGQCSDALPLFQVVLDRSANNLNARFAKANCDRILGRPDEAEAELLTLLDALKDTDQLSLRSLVLGRLGTVNHLTGRLDEAHSYLLAGLEEARRSGDNDAIGKLLNSQALLAKDRENNQKARELLGQAALVYRDAGRKVLPGQIHSALANLSMSDGNWSQAEEHLNEALASFRTLGDRRGEAMMMNNYGYLRRQQGRMEEAETLHLTSMEIRRDIGDRVGQARIMSMLSVLYHDQHRYTDARNMALQAIEITTQAKDRLFMATSYAQLASAQNALGQRAEARDAYGQALRLFGDLEDEFRSNQVELRLAQLDLEEGDTAAAQERVDSVMASAEAQQRYELIIESLEHYGDIAHYEKRAKEAREYYERALTTIDQHNFKQRQPALWIKLGQAYLDAGKPEFAEPLLGLLLAGKETVDTKKFHAKVTFYKGDAMRAAELMASAKALDARRWSDEDERILDRYRLATGTQTH